jgi:poly(A) polymerase
MAPQIHQVSVERIQGEIVRILAEGQARAGVRMLHESGLLREVLPEVPWSDHLARCLELLIRGVDSDLAMAVLLHEVQVADVEKVMERLKFSRAEISHTVCLVAHASQFRAVRSMTNSSLKKFLRMPRFEDHMSLERICRTSSDASLEDYDFARDKLRSWTREDISPAPLITGEDLIGMGFSPGPLFKEILSVVEDEQLEGRLTDRGAAMEFVTSHYGHKQ